MIDLHTAKDLELVRNAVNNKQMGSLMGKPCCRWKRSNTLTEGQMHFNCSTGILNFCSTPMGERLLRMNILQPLSGDCISKAWTAIWILTHTCIYRSYLSGISTRGRAAIEFECRCEFLKWQSRPYTHIHSHLLTTYSTFMIFDKA